MERRKARVVRLMQLDEAKTYLLLNFSRVFTYNSIVLNPIVRAVVLSIIPMDYQIRMMTKNFFEV